MYYLRRKHGRKPKEGNSYFVTFLEDSELAQNYQEVIADSFDQAHQKVVAAYGALWAFIFHHAEFHESKRTNGLIKIEGLL